MRVSVIVVCLILVTVAANDPTTLLFAAERPATSAEPRKQAWQWTLEERMALRTDAAAARERVQERERAGRGKRAQTNSAQPGKDQQPSRTVDAFDGSTHPELFLPHEVFRSLVSLAFLGPARADELFQRSLMPEVKRLALPADFWQRLRSLSAVHIADAWALQDLGNSLGAHSVPARRRIENTLAQKQDEFCRSRADALAAARKEFGKERFDRFLYEAIAIHKFLVEDHLPDPAVLRRIEGGCR